MKQLEKNELKLVQGGKTLPSSEHTVVEQSAIVLSEDTDQDPPIIVQ